MNDYTTYDLIDKYLRDLMSAEEKTAFEMRLQNESELREEVATHRLANELIVDNALLAIKHQLKQLHAESSSPTKRDFGTFYFGLGMVVLAALIGGFMLFNFESEKVTVELPQTQPVKEKIESIVIKELAVVEDNQELLAEKPKNEKLILEKTPIKAEIVAAESEQKMVSSDNKNTTTQPTSNNKAVSSNPEKNDQEIQSVNPNVKTVEVQNYYRCEGVIIEPRVSASSTCGGQKNGIIQFEIPTFGGTPPFEYSVDGGKTYSRHLIFENQADGNYDIIIKDSENCKSNPKRVTINKEDCSYVFYPLQQQVWEIPLSRFAGEFVELKIMSAKTGEVVHQTQFDSSFSTTWDGTDQNGRELAMGSYVYIITSKESPKRENGQVTIVK